MMTPFYCLDGSVVWAHVPTPPSNDRGHDPYDSLKRRPIDDTIEFSVPDTIEVITLCSDE